MTNGFIVTLLTIFIVLSTVYCVMMLKFCRTETSEIDDTTNKVVNIIGDFICIIFFIIIIGCIIIRIII